MTQTTILEGFGEDPDGFSCDSCGEDRRYYDKLSNDEIVCLECSTKMGYEMDPNGTFHQRDASVLSSDPELLEIADNITQWKIGTGVYTELSIKIPQESMDQLLAMAKSRGTTVEVLINAGVGLMLNQHQE
jgi:hypothetical protein